MEGDESARFVSLPWRPIPDRPPADTTRLRIRVPIREGAMALARVDVRETRSQVFVTVIARWDPRADPTAPTRDVEAVARLDRPLGDRTLVHAPTDDLPRRD